MSGQRELKSRAVTLREEIARISNTTLGGDFKRSEDRDFWVKRLKQLTGELSSIEEMLRPKRLTRAVAASNPPVQRNQRAAPADAPVAEPAHGWITMAAIPGGGRVPVYTHGEKKPSYGAELDALLGVYPVYARPPAPEDAKDAARDVLREVRDWDHRGDSVQERYDEIHGAGAYDAAMVQGEPG